MLPPPPIAPKPRNDRNNTTSSSYRNRPVSNNFNNAKMLFNNLSQPQTRTTLSNAVKTPFVQKAVIAGVENNQVRESAVVAGGKVAKDEKFKQQLADIIKQFDKSPAITSTNNTNHNSSKSSLMSSSNTITNNFIHPISPEPLDPFTNSNTTKNTNYNLSQSLLLTPQNTTTTNTTTTSTRTNNIMSTSKNSSMTIDDILFGDVGQNKKTAPSRPPPPKKKLGSINTPSYSSELDNYEQYQNQQQHHQQPINFYNHEQSSDYRSTLSEPFNPYCPSNKYGPGLAALEKNLRSSPDIHITEPYAIAIYPYKPNHFDEIPCEVNDIIILIREIDEYWVEGKNYRTGVSGIIPLNYLQIKLPLAPVTSSESPYYSSGYGSTSSLSSPKNSDISSGKICHGTPIDNDIIVCTALYDYDSNIEGDLKFCAGDLIVIHERLNNDWLRGQIGKNIGIFPITYVNIENLDSIPFHNNDGGVSKNKEVDYVKALYEYKSPVEGDLTFNVGDCIKIIEKINDDWIKGELHGVVGLVPMTYVEKV